MKTEKVSVFFPLLLAAGLSTTATISSGQDAPIAAPITSDSLPSRNLPFNWIAGPARASFGDYAEIAVPDGYRFVGAADAAIMLRLMNNPVPQTLAGVLAPASPDQDWFVVFEFNEAGYVSDAASEQLNSDAILKQVRAKVERQNELAPQLGASSIATVRWEIPPSYDPQTYMVTWALRAETGPQKVINHVVRLLGRRGFIDAIAVQPSSVEVGAVPLKELMSHVSFKTGESYADYQKGDRISDRSLQELIANDGVDDNQGRSRMAWIIAGVSIAGCGGLGGLVVARRSRRRRLAAIGTAIPGEGVPPVLAPPIVKTNGHAHPHTNGKQTRGRRIFNYQQYYSDLILQVSDRAYDFETPSLRQHASVPNAGQLQETAAPAAAVNAHLQLIAEQKSLIEEQLRLIREQTRLIEEKTRLIQEKNKVLEKQAELFGNNIF